MMKLHMGTWIHAQKMHKKESLHKQPYIAQQYLYVINFAKKL